MFFRTFGLQASSSDTTKVLYVLRFRALRIDSREQFHGFKTTCSRRISFKMLNSKTQKTVNVFRFRAFRMRPRLNPGVLDCEPKSKPGRAYGPHWANSPRAASKTPPRWPHDGPRWPQDGPKTAPGGIKIAQDSLKTSPRQPQVCCKRTDRL